MPILSNSQISIKYSLQLSTGGQGRSVGISFGFSSSCFLGSTVRTGQQIAGYSSSDLHMVAKLIRSFLWKELLPFLYLSRLNPIFRHIIVEYLPSGFYFHRHRELCTEVRGSKGLPLWGLWRHRRGLSTRSETGQSTESKHQGSVILLCHNIHVSLAWIWHVLRPPVPP